MRLTTIDAPKSNRGADDGGDEDGEARRWVGREDSDAASLIFALAWCGWLFPRFGPARCADSMRRRSTATRDARVDWQRSRVTRAVVGRRGGFTSAVGWSRYLGGGQAEICRWRHRERSLWLELPRWSCRHGGRFGRATRELDKSIEFIKTYSQSFFG
jgi:hypothetical protein